ncbi:hypothetical protein [Rhizohabitans arisaemae]|uniref:hypothetical protein n=1 Tax=Rhizohabitans arisaemae TaxID=2720610 RepID=UPI0024B03C91|nr:hypothetical protein [Rhizohabitans arisaemae]
MKRYLLFDGGCRLCTSVARGVEEDAGHWLQARSLHDPEMAALLGEHRPSSRTRPALVTDDGSRVRVWTGLAMSIRLAAGVGPRRAARIVRRIARMPAAEGEGTSRRSALRATGAGALALLGLTFGSGTAAAVTGDGDGGPILMGEALSAAVEAAQGSPEVRSALTRVAGLGYGAEPAEAVAFTTGTGSTIVVLFFPLVSDPLNQAAVISHEFGPEITNKTLVEFVAANPDAWKSGVLKPGDITVAKARPGELAPAGAGEYISCLVFCVGVSCAGPASRCRGLIFMWAVLACMVAVCGSKVRVCHGSCKGAW